MKWIFIVSLFFLVACQTETDEMPDGKLLKSIELKNGNGTQIWGMNFTLDSKNRVIKMEESDTDTGSIHQKSSWIFSYDGNKRLPREGIQIVTWGNNQQNHHHYYSYPGTNDIDPPNDSTVITNLLSGAEVLYLTKFKGLHVGGPQQYTGIFTSYSMLSVGQILNDSVTFEIDAFAGGTSTSLFGEHHDVGAASPGFVFKRSAEHFLLSPFGPNPAADVINPFNQLNIAPLFFFSFNPLSLFGDYVCFPTSRNLISASVFQTFNYLISPTYELNTYVYHSYGINRSGPEPLPIYDTLGIKYIDNFNGETNSSLYVKYNYQ